MRRVFAQLTVLATAGIAAVGEAQLFLTTPSLPLGSGQPTVLLTADLDGDGLDDVIVTQFETFSMTPLLNRGDGTLQPVGQFNTGGRPVGALASDVDGDGHIDVMIAEEESDNAWFLRGRGDGTFEAARGPIYVGHDPLVLSGGDFNGDGHFDLAIALSAEGTASLSLVLGNGDGTFGPPVIDQRLQDFGIAVGVGDFNRDGHLDMIGSYSQTSLALLLGNGDGTFAPLQEIPTVSRTVVLIVRDLDGDERLDLFLVHTGADVVAVLRGNGDGTFTPAGVYPAGVGPAYTALADFNGDGALDAAVHSTAGRDVRMLLGDGQGGFGPPRAFAAVGEVQMVGSVFLDADGIPDVVAATRLQAETRVAFFFGRADGTLAAAENLLGGTAAGGAVADVDGDGLPDLVMAIPAAQQVAVAFGRPGGGLGPVLPGEPLVLAPGRVAAGLFDADDIVDLIAASTTVRQALFLRGRGDGTFVSGVALSPGSGAAFAGAGAADVNGDGRLDAVLTQLTGHVAVFPGRGDGTFDEPITTATGGAGAPALCDLDNDGHLDMAILDNVQGQVAVFLGDGTGAFTPGARPTGSRQAPAILCGDFNQDGADDLAFADLLGRQIRVLLNNGAAQFPNAISVRTDDLPMSFAVRDVAGDGRPDLLVATQANGLLTAFVNQGNAFTAESPAGTGVRPAVALSADFDGDGRYDAATLSATGVQATLVTTIGGSHVARGDGNGDGVVTAGDLVALSAQRVRGEGQRVDTASRGLGATAGTDANGDGLITRQDVGALLRRLF